MQVVAGDVAGLIRQAKGYDRAAFGELYRRTLTPVYRYLAARLSSAEECEELTQEVFLAALSGIQSLRAVDEVGLLGWLFQIARHKLADHLRRRYNRPTALLAEADGLDATQPLPYEVAEHVEERDALRQAVDKLTPEQREVILCKYVLGYDNERTGGLVGKNSNAVNQLHHRALASLHRLLATTGKAG